MPIKLGEYNYRKQWSLHNPRCACELLNSQELRVFKVPCGPPSPQCFLLSFQSVSYQPRLAELPQIVPVLNNSHWLFSPNILGLVLFSRGISELSQIKTSPQNAAFQQVARQIKQCHIFGAGVLGTPQISLLLLGPARLLAFTIIVVVRLWVFKATPEQGRKDRIRAH